eukprot:scaffold1738_cov171-Pinguiococcus_pyrenoidosus.AAC.2
MSQISRSLAASRVIEARGRHSQLGLLQLRYPPRGWRRRASFPFALLGFPDALVRRRATLLPEAACAAPLPSLSRGVARAPAA